MLTPGSVLSGRYRLQDRIATGGMGEVWRATDITLKREVAVKAMRADLHHDASFGARFRAEARTMAALHHPGVVNVYDYGEIDDNSDDELAYLVMTYIHGEPLSNRIHAAGYLSPADTMGIVTQVANALEAAHAAGVIHRDVKPDNLLVEADGRVVLVDFGVALTDGAAGLTGVGQVVGTALYMAPEQVTRQNITPAIDIYALGAVAYHCLVGHPPFTGETALSVALSHLSDEPPPLPTSIPAAVRAVVTTAMAKNPADRYPSAAAMAVAAAEAQTSPSTTRTMTQPGLDVPAAFAVGVAGPAAGPGTAFGGTSGGRGGTSVDAFGDGAPAGGGVAGVRTGAMPTTRPVSSPPPARAAGRPGRPRRAAAVIAGSVVVLGGAAVALALALNHPDTSSNRPGTSTVPVTTQSSHPTKHTAPAGGGAPTGGPSTSAPTTTPSGTATPTGGSTPTTKPTPTPTNPPPSAPGDGGGGAGGNPGGSAPPSAPPTDGAASPGGGVTIVLPGSTQRR